MTEENKRKSNAFHRVNLTGSAVLIDENGKHLTLEVRRVYIDNKGNPVSATYSFTCWISERMRRHLSRFQPGAWLSITGQLIPTFENDERGKGNPPMTDGVAEYWIDVAELSVLAQQAPANREDLLYMVFVGNLTRDPEMKYHEDKPVTNMSVATNYKQYTANGATVDHVIWIQFSVWGKRAESIKEWFKKGKPILIEVMAPEVSTDTFGPIMYNGRNGQDARFKMKIWNWSFVPGGGSGDGASSTPAIDPFGDFDPNDHDESPIPF